MVNFDLSNSDTVYHFCEGHDATSHASFGEAAHIAVTLHMHEEASYEGLDPIESEVRRRAFWILFEGESDIPLPHEAFLTRVLSSSRQIHVDPPGKAHLSQGRRLYTSLSQRGR